MKTKSLAILIAVACGLMAVLPKTHAVVPAPDGCYPNFTTAEGCNALSLLTTGAANTGLGWRSLFSDSTGSFNTAVGAGALVLNNADSNTAVGAAAMLLNTIGVENVAVGASALLHNNGGGDNSAVGAFALSNNITGSDNSASGAGALLSNIHGMANTAMGSGALSHNDMTGAGLADENTAVGALALFANTNGTANAAVGSQALSSNDTGAANTAVGYRALLNNIAGNSNTILGAGAGFSVMSASNVICIGYNVTGADVNNTTWIGNVFGSTTISGTTMPVIVSNTGQFGTMSSSRRFKKEIKPMDQTSESILALKPVAFRYKTDDTNTPQFGLIAEEVAEVNPDLVVRDDNGQIYSVRYDAVNAMLLNEFLKEHRKVAEQKAAITELRSVVAQQQKEFRAAMAEQQKEMENVLVRLKQQEAKIQRVNDRIELTKFAPEAVANIE